MKTIETESLNGINDNDVAILIPSFDGYQDLWEPFFACFFKYWPDCPYPVFLGSNFQTYVDHRVIPIRIGYDRDYSSNLIAMLSQIQQDWVIIIVEDVLLCNHVNTGILENVINEGKQQNAGLVQLLSGRFSPNAEFVSIPTYEELSEIPLDVPYRVSINLGFWKKSVLFNLLQPGETAWDFEYKGSTRTSSLENRFFCLSRKYISNPIFRYVHGVIKREWTFEASKFLRQEGLWATDKKRSIQTLSSHFYLKIYVIIRYWAFWIVYRLWGASGMMKLVSKKNR